MVATSRVGGAVQSVHRYGPFGEPDTAAGVRFRYTGQQLIGGLGLYYYKARFYSPALGRFLQTDPIGYGDGLNLYAYVGNDPLNRTDPGGLAMENLGREFGNSASAALGTPGVQLSLGGGAIGGGTGYLMGSVAGRVLAGAAATVMELQGAADGIPAVGGRWTGSGPAPGVIGITDSTSVSALRNYYPKNGGVEFVYDSASNTFAAGRPANGLFSGSPHQQLAQSINAEGSSVVGGTLQRGSNGGFITTEQSGHFGQNWTPEIRQQFQSWLGGRTGLSVDHHRWGSP